MAANLNAIQEGELYDDGEGDDTNPTSFVPQPVHPAPLVTSPHAPLPSSRHPFAHHRHHLAEEERKRPRKATAFMGRFEQAVIGRPQGSTSSLSTMTVSFDVIIK